jgi:endonuclease YncB( thermonuclease family)
MEFEVAGVFDGDTLEVSPDWRWGDESGNVVRAKGYDTPEEGQPGYREAKHRLAVLILGKEVELENPVRITYGRLLCDVYYEGRNLADYFPEYQ